MSKRQDRNSWLDSLTTADLDAMVAQAAVDREAFRAATLSGATASAHTMRFSVAPHARGYGRA